jgi:membrane protein
LENALSHLIEKEKRKVLFKNIGTFLVLFYKKTTSEGVLKEAAALTYITLLGFIPFLLLIVFLVPKLSIIASKTNISRHLYENFLPVSTSEVGDMISQLMTKQVTFNLFSLILALVTSYSLFKVIRDSFDRILVMEFQPPKDFLSQLLKFFGTIIFGFIIILMLFSSTSLPIISGLMNFPLFHGLLIFILPFILQFLALVFLYMLLPSTKVKRSALYRGAFWTTLIWVIVKGGFDYYIYNLTNIEAVYGVLKTLPIFLFWLYVNWVIILGGMVLVTILEHKEKALDEVVEKHYVRVTMEMYTNRKKDKEMEAFLHKEDVPGLVDKLIEEIKE